MMEMQKREQLAGDRKGMKNKEIESLFRDLWYGIIWYGKRDIIIYIIWSLEGILAILSFTTFVLRSDANFEKGRFFWVGKVSISEHFIIDFEFFIEDKVRFF